MSLSQATSPEEVKRDIKLQVFLAMNNKFSHSQTDKLIEDVNKVTNDITGSFGVPQSSLGKSDKPTSAAEISKAIMDQPYNAILTNDKSEALERPATETRNVDFLFLGSNDEDHIDGTIESVPVCSNGTPINSRVKKPIPTERGMGMADYYLREISIDAKARHAKVYFYATNAYIDNWSEQKLLDTIKRISLFHSR